MSVANTGKTVTWTKHRQLGRPAETRTGVIIAFVPAGRSMSTECRAATKKDYSEVDAVDIATVARYLVRVDRKHKKTGKPLKPEWLAPYASVIDFALFAQSQPDRQRLVHVFAREAGEPGVTGTCEVCESTNASITEPCPGPS